LRQEKRKLSSSGPAFADDPILATKQLALLADVYPILCQSRFFTFFFTLISSFGKTYTFVVFYGSPVPF